MVAIANDSLQVRREKISDRMKLLQDLVPGCSKVTGKAVMLDEIINYVRSLQRQVEVCMIFLLQFLSMKLSTVNPRLALDVESFIRKDVISSRPLETGSERDDEPLVHRLVTALNYAG